MIPDIVLMSIVGILVFGGLAFQEVLIDQLAMVNEEQLVRPEDLD